MVTNLIFLYCLCSGATCQHSLHRVTEGGLMVPLQDQKHMYVPRTGPCLPVWNPCSLCEWEQLKGNIQEVWKGSWKTWRTYCMDLARPGSFPWGPAAALFPLSSSFPCFFARPRTQLSTPCYRESPVTNKGPSQAFLLHPAVSRVTMGNLETWLGPQTEDTLRARSQSSHSFHSGQWKDRLFCDWTMRVLRVYVCSIPATVLAKLHCVGPHWSWETSKWRPCLGKQRHWWSWSGERE